MMCAANMFKNLCRLCLGPDGLLYIFDDKMADNMAEIIEVTSGVLISKSDTITQLVCSTCCQITIKMYKFRTSSMKNDKELKARFAGYNIAQLTNSNALVNKPEIVANVKSPVPAVELASITPLVQRIQQPQEQKYKFAHSSIKEIIKKNPNIKLPEISLKSHFGACITLLSDEVDEWFKERNISDDEISLLKKIAHEQSLERINEKVSRKRSMVLYEYSSDNSNEEVAGTSTDLPSVKNKRLKIRPPKPAVSESKVSIPQANPSKRIKLGYSFERPKTCNRTDKKHSKLTEETDFKLSKHLPHNDVQKDLERTSLNDVLEKKPSQKRGDPNHITLKSLNTSSDVDSKSHTNRDLDNDDDMMIDNGIPESCDPEVSEESNKNKQNDATQGGISSPPCEVRESESRDDQKKKNDSNDVPQKINENAKHEEINYKRKCDNKNLFEIETGVKPLVAFEDCTLFTTRPFIKSVTKTKPSFKIQMEGSEELLILSDSDEDTGISLPSQTMPSNDHLKEETAKTSFAKSLELKPRDAPCNQPDLSLVSANRSHTLYVCKICESHHHNLRDLKHHKRKNHSKCPFCNKKFRSLANRDEHIKKNCEVNQKPPKLKPLKLCLVRVDEDEEIRRKYSRAFENLTFTSDDDNPSSRASMNNREREKSDLRNADQTKSSAVSETTDVVEEMEKPLEYAESIHRGSNKSESSATSLAKKTELKDQTDICISNEERESPKVGTPPKKSRRKVNTLLKNMNIRNVLKDNNLNDSDVIRLVKKIIRSNEYNNARATAALQNSVIINGETSKVKIFKNLRKHMQHYKIPIEVKYNPTVVVEYKTPKAPAPKSVSDLWTSMIPQQLKRTISSTTQMTTASMDYEKDISNQQATTRSSVIIPPASIIDQPQTSSPQPMVQMKPIGSTSNPLTNPLYSAAVSKVHTTTPIIHSGTQNICNSSTNNNYNNIILLSGGMLTSTQQSLIEASSSLPAIGSAKGIEERTLHRSATSSSESIFVKDTLSTTNSLESLHRFIPYGGLHSNGNVNTTASMNWTSNCAIGAYPSIRVKNISELS